MVKILNCHQEIAEMKKKSIISKKSDGRAKRMKRNTFQGVPMQYIRCTFDLRHVKFTLQLFGALASFQNIKFSER